MARYLVRYTTTLSVDVLLDADDEDEAAELAWDRAEEYADTLYGQPHRGVTAIASFDGVGANSVEEASA